MRLIHYVDGCLLGKRMELLAKTAGKTSLRSPWKQQRIFTKGYQSPKQYRRNEKTVLVKTHTKTFGRAQEQKIKVRRNKTGQGLLSSRGQCSGVLVTKISTT